MIFEFLSSFLRSVMIVRRSVDFVAVSFGVRGTILQPSVV